MTFCIIKVLQSAVTICQYSHVALHSYIFSVNSAGIGYPQTDDAAGDNLCAVLLLHAHVTNANMALMALQASRRKLSAGTSAVAHPTTPAETEVDRWSEVEVWHRILHLMEVAKQKQGNALIILPCYVLYSLSLLNVCK